MMRLEEAGAQSKRGNGCSRLTKSGLSFVATAVAGANANRHTRCVGGLQSGDWWRRVGSEEGRVER
jgi:hypothetical protein